MSRKPQVVQSSATVGAVCAQHNLLALDKNNVIRVPFLIKGQLRVPEIVSIGVIEAAFAEKELGAGPADAKATHCRIGQTQVLREPVIDRQTLKQTGEYTYSAMPLVTADELIERDVDGLADELYNLPVDAILEFVDGVRQAILVDGDFVHQVRENTRKTAEQPDHWHDAGFAAIPMLFNRQEILKGIDTDLSVWGIPGSRLLEEWQPVDAPIMPMPVHMLADTLFGNDERRFVPRRARLRATPTRQLHITAGNTPQIPIISALRAISTKSPAVVKSPFGATTPGALLALAAVAAAPDHPLTRHLSIVYWRGGDEEIESDLFIPDAFDRIIVWGAPDAVLSLKSRTLFTKVLTFNPCYGVSLIGREAFHDDLMPIAIRVCCDALVANQKACIATQVIYVEGDDAQLEALAKTVQQVLAQFDQAAPNILKPSQIGEVKRLMKGRFLDADWYVNERDGFFTSGVVVAKDEFDIALHPMCRMIILSKVKDLAETSVRMHHGVSTVSIYPRERYLSLRNRIAARGVSNVLELGHSGSVFSGQSHDGMMVLSELVDWKNG
ncbi:MAG: acyl-CoA reductase [Candidatus Binatia bacterium]